MLWEAARKVQDEVLALEAARREVRPPLLRGCDATGR